jgi:hypothetical protein
MLNEDRDFEPKFNTGAQFVHEKQTFFSQPKKGNKNQELPDCFHKVFLTINKRCVCHRRNTKTGAFLALPQHFREEDSCLC